MKIHVGKLPIETCNEILFQISKHDVDPYLGNMDLDPNNKFYQDHLLQKELAEKAGYNSGSGIEFRHYYPKKHFDIDLAIQFAEIVRAKHIMSFVSEIRPGKCAPWHWDINPWQDEHEKSGSLVRFFCFIGEPKMGQVFMVENDCYHFEEQGSIYQYPQLDSWHAGANVGFDKKFLYTFTGAK